MASVNYNDLTPEEQQRLSEAQKQHNEQLQASKNLEDTIKQLAANNRRDGNKDKIAYTENRLAIREYSDSMRQSMSTETSKLFDQLEEINVESRKQTKSEQRDNLKQLEVLKELSKNIQDDDQKLELQKYISSTEESIRMNTNKFTSFVSRSMDNFGDIGAILSGLNDSPLLSMGFAYFGNKITDAMKERREQKYALQEGTENQLFELLQEREESTKKQEALLNEIAKRQGDDTQNDSDNSDDLPIVIDDESLSKLSNDEVQTLLNNSNDELSSIDSKLDDLKSINDSINSKSNEPKLETFVNNNITIPEMDLDLSTLNLSSLQDLLEEANYELISINSSIQDFLNNTIAIDKNSSQEPIQIPLNDEQRDLSEEMVYQLLDINEKLLPLLNGLEERKRESEIFNDQLLNAIQNINKESATAGGKLDEDSGVGNIFGKLKTSLIGVIGGFVGTIMTKFKTGLSVVAKAIPKILSKLFVPLTIVMGLFSGVTEAIDEFKKTGSIKDAIIGFFGGILDFLTFGILGTDSINNVLDSISSYIQPVFDLLKKPFEYVSNFLDGMFGADNMDKAFDILKTYNPVTLMFNHLKNVFEFVSNLINDIMSVDYGKMIKEQVTSIFGDNVVGQKLKSMFSDDDEEEKPKRQLSKQQLKRIETHRARTRDNLNSVYKVQDIPMNKDDYSKASKNIVSNNEKGSSANNNFSNVNVSNNNQTIVAPLPTVHNNDYNIRRLNNNPY